MHVFCLWDAWLPCVSFFHTSPGPLSLGSKILCHLSNTDNGKFQVTEPSVFPSLRGQVVASWIQVPWVNLCIRWLERSGIQFCKNLHWAPTICQALGFLPGIQKLSAIQWLCLEELMLWQRACDSEPIWLWVLWWGGGKEGKETRCYRCTTQGHQPAWGCPGSLHGYVIPGLRCGGWSRKGEGGLSGLKDFIDKGKDAWDTSLMKMDWRHGNWFWGYGVYTLTIYLNIWEKICSTINLRLPTVYSSFEGAMS